MALNAPDRALVSALEAGLPLTARPYRTIARQIGLSEEQVMAQVSALCERAIIKRMGVIVRHHELGYRANVMVVWDVPDKWVDETGEWLGTQARITLCYRRPRRPPHWPYNLFCMIHDQDRSRARETVVALRRHPVLRHVPYAMLFSGRRFKQRGARYSPSGSGKDDRHA